MSGGVSAGTMITAAGVGMSAYGSYRQSAATKAATAYQSGVSANNAQIAQWQAADALQRGQVAEQDVRQRTAQMMGTQRARMAANGVAIDEGSPLNILDDTAYMGERDAITTRNNAKREAWGYQNQAAGMLSDSQMLQSSADAQSPFLAGATSLIGGAGQVASSWYSYNKTKSAPTTAG